jgi:hypothetical protein
MRYALVENGAVIDGPRALPKAWRNISGLHFLSDPELAALGWLPWRLVETEGEVITGSTVEITATEIVETQTRRAKTADEVAAETEALAESLRDQRDEILRACDFTQLDDSPSDKAAWAAFRALLRAVTNQPGWPTDVTWPEPPDGNPAAKIRRMPPLRP